MDRKKNPYSATELPAEEDFVATLVGCNPHLQRLFFTQRIVLVSVFGYLGLILLTKFWPAFPDTVYQAMSTICLVTLCVFWYFVFRAATWNHNAWVGLGHVVLSAFLTPCLLVGVFLVPVLIRGDAERLADT